MDDSKQQIDNFILSDGSDVEFSDSDVEPSEPSIKRARTEVSGLEIQESSSEEVEANVLHQPKPTPSIAGAWNLVQESNVTVPRKAFEATPGPCHGITGEDPLSYFMYFLPDSFLCNLAQWTNEYAEQRKQCGDAKVMSRWKDLHLTDHTELLAFFGIHLHLGMCSPPEIRDLWSQDDLFERVQGVCSAMSHERFSMINRNLHCNSPEIERQVREYTAQVSKAKEQKHAQHADVDLKPDQGKPDRLIKVRPLLTMLREKFMGAIVPEEEVAIDEAMIGFKGRLAILQYTPLKPTKRGIKVWVLACESGYVYNFDVYTGKVDGKVCKDLGERVVLDLSDPLSHKGYTVYCDRFFTSPSLAESLWKQGTHICGTVNSTRKGLPSSVSKPTLKKMKMKRGDSFTMQSNAQSEMCLSAWMDSKPVTVLSTGMDVKQDSVLRRVDKAKLRDSVGCPTAVKKYNKHMGYVDQADAFRSSYMMGRKSVRWWTRVFWYCIDTSIVNAFILFNMNLKASGKPPMRQLQFRRLLRSSLILPQIERVKEQKRQPSFSFAPNIFHMHDQGGCRLKAELKLPRGNTRKCVTCKKRVPYVCSCSVSVCNFAECWEKHHKYNSVGRLLPDQRLLSTK